MKHYGPHYVARTDTCTHTQKVYKDPHRQVLQSKKSVRFTTPPDSPLGKMTWDYFGFSYTRSEAPKNYKVNNAADIAVIVAYFVVVLGVGLWVSGFFCLFFSLCE